MALFDPEWYKLIREPCRPSTDHIRSLEKIRTSYRIPHSDFASFVAQSPMGLERFLESSTMVVVAKVPDADTKTLLGFAYSNWIFSSDGKTGGVAALKSYMLENPKRMITMYKYVKNMTDLTLFIILELGLYSDASPQVRELYARIDVACCWDAYSSFSHIPPATPEAPKEYTFKQSLKIVPFTDELLAGIAQKEPVLIMAYDIATRSGTHPYQVLLFLEDLGKAMQSRLDSQQ